MAFTARLTFYFSYDRYGFSETWWRGSNTFSDLSDPIAQYLLRRLKLLRDKVSCQGVRISVEGSSRSGIFVLPGDTDLGSGLGLFHVYSAGLAPTASFAQGQDQAKAILQVQAANNGRALGLRYMFGIPDVVSKTEPAVTDFNNPSGWWDDFKAWRDYVIANGWLIKTLDKQNTNPEVPIIAWQQQASAPNLLGAVCAAGSAPDVEPSDRVLIRAVRMVAQGLRSPNGTWVVQSKVTDSVTGETAIFLYNTSVLAPGQIKLPGTIRKQRYIYLPPTMLNPYRVGTHKRGGPTPRPVGRRVRQRFGV